jgi:hypothetical protein
MVAEGASESFAHIYLPRYHAPVDHNLNFHRHSLRGYVKLGPGNRNIMCLYKSVYFGLRKFKSCREIILDS